MRFTQVSILFLFFTLLCFNSSGAQDLSRPGGWVDDFPGVVTDKYKEKVNSLIQELQEKTSSEVLIVVKNSADPFDEKEYAGKLFDEWQVGKEEKDNGVLLLLVLDKKRSSIKVGKPLEEILPESVCKEITLKYITPYLDSGEYEKGIYAAVTEIAKVIADNARVSLEAAGGVNAGKPIAKKEEISPLLYVFVFIFFLLWNFPLPLYFGVLSSVILAVLLASFSKLVSFWIIIGCVVSLLARYLYWLRLPPNERRSFTDKLWFKGLSSAMDTGGKQYQHRGAFGSGGFGGTQDHANIDEGFDLIKGNKKG